MFSTSPSIFTLTLENGSVTNGDVQFETDGDNKLNIFTGADISNTTFTGVGYGYGSNLIDLKGSGSNTFDISTAVGINSLQKDDAGTWTLTRSAGAGASTAQFVVNAGTLVGSTSSIANDVSVASGATLQLDQASDATFANIVSGGGALVQSGNGTLTLSNANTYSGGTTVLGGVLQIGTGGTTGAITGDVTDNATLAFNRSDDVTFSGVISGTGVLQQNGTGTMILTGANTYSGGTLIGGGTLQIGDGGTTGAIVGDVTNNGVLAFDRSGTITFGGVISGSGALNQIGTGTTILNGANAYTGATTISAGTLQVGDSSHPGAKVGSSVNVASAAILKGFGTVGGNVTNAGGTVSPGGSIGTLTVGGNYSQTGGTFTSEISPTSASSMNVGGTATINSGALALNFDPGTYPVESLTLIHSGGLTGAFDTVNQSGLPSLRTMTLVESPTDLSPQYRAYANQLKCRCDPNPATDRNSA